jgi:hypothetical protein
VKLKQRINVVAVIVLAAALVATSARADGPDAGAPPATASSSTPAARTSPPPLALVSSAPSPGEDLAHALKTCAAAVEKEPPPSGPTPTWSIVSAALAGLSSTAAAILAAVAAQK